MTETTKTRQIKLLIGGVLKAYDIDNLQLEIDMLSGIQRVLESEEPVRTRESYIQKIREALGKNAAQQSEDELIETQLKRLRLNWTPFSESEKDTFRRFLKDDKQTGGVKLNEFVDWWLQDEWRLAHPPQKLDKIMIMYPQAVKVDSGRKMERL